MFCMSSSSPIGGLWILTGAKHRCGPLLLTTFIFLYLSFFFNLFKNISVYVGEIGVFVWLRGHLGQKNVRLGIYRISVVQSEMIAPCTVGSANVNLPAVAVAALAAVLFRPVLWLAWLPPRRNRSVNFAHLAASSINFFFFFALRFSAPDNSFSFIFPIFASSLLAFFLFSFFSEK